MKFNATATGTKTVNRAGGEAFKQDAKLELVSLLLTSFVSDKFYESETEQLKRLRKLVVEIPDKSFLAKAGIYARTQFGMRSITHVLAAEIAHEVKGQNWTNSAISKMVYRVDDMTEILSYYESHYGRKPIPNSLKKGFAKALERFDAYQLAKYRAEGKKVKLIDVINVAHPVPATPERAKLYKDLLTGNLKSTETWESKLTKAGQAATNDEEKEQFKKDVWISLLNEKKIGYFALLRNLRNIYEQAPEVLDKALEMIVDENLIKKSLVFPFRFDTAIKQFDERNIISALSKALEISVSNVPVFSGKTLVVLDVSGSMAGKPIDIGSIFAAVLYKANNADFIMFADGAKYLSIDPNASTYSIAWQLKNMATGGGTDFHSIFKCAKRAYDRIIILSDMQGWIGHDCPVATYNAYRVNFTTDPFIYSFDLNGYGDMQMPQRNVFCIAGFSDKIFDVMKLLETDRNALVNEIEKIIL